MKATDSTNTKLVELREADFGELATLALTIWHEHYGTIISAAQIDYMLGDRFTAENLRRYLFSKERWLNVLRTQNAAIGYCSYALAEVSSESQREMKLEQLYLLQAFRGRGLGGLMLKHVEDCARALGCATVMLQVNKQNTGSVAVYKKSGFTVREEKVFDIGRGYVMDDYVMVKQLNKKIN